MTTQTTEFKSIVITNITYNKVISTLEYNAQNEKKADAYARYENITHPHNGMISIHS